MTRIQIADEKKSYMRQLDDWTDEFVIDPIWNFASETDGKERDEEADDLLITNVRKEIRDKVLESYRNGQKAGPYKRKEK